MSYPRRKSGLFAKNTDKNTERPLAMNGLHSRKYGGPWVSRHNQMSHGTTKNSLGTTKYITAQPNVSRHNQISLGTTKYLTAQPNSSRHNQKLSRQNQIFNSRQNRKTHPKTNNSLLNRILNSQQNGVTSRQK